MVRFLTPPPKTTDARTSQKENLEKLRQVIETANTEAETGVVTEVKQKVNTSSILSNTLRVSCGTDMCLSKNLNLQDFSCEDLSDSDCRNHPDKCGMVVKIGDQMSCGDKCTYDTDNINPDCASKPTADECTSNGTCRWQNGACAGVSPERNRESCSAQDGCVYANIQSMGVSRYKCITDFRKTARRGCFAKCKAASAEEKYDCLVFEEPNKQGVCPSETRLVKTNKEKAMCKDWVKDTKLTKDMQQQLTAQFNCTGDECPEVTNISDANATAMCNQNTCINDAKSGYDSILSPLFNDQNEVRPCPEIDGKQYWPFSIRGKGYEFSQLDCVEVCNQHDSQSACEQANCSWLQQKPTWKTFSDRLIAVDRAVRVDPQTIAINKQHDRAFFSLLPTTTDTDEMNTKGLGFYIDETTTHIVQTAYGSPTFPWQSLYQHAKQMCQSDLIFTQNALVVGEGDDAMCIIKNVNQSNQMKQAQEVLSQTLSSVNLSTIRGSLSKIGRDVAQSGFSWLGQSSVQNLSKNIISSAREIRSQAAQTCGSTQSARNTFWKTCKNMAQNGRALPCVVDGVQQENLAQSAGACLQQVMLDTNVLSEAVQNVNQQSTALLDGFRFPNIFSQRVFKPVRWIQLINTVLTLWCVVVVIVGMLSALFATRSSHPTKYIVTTIGVCVLLLGVAFGFVGYTFGGTSILTPSTNREKNDYKTYLGLRRLPVDGRKDIAIRTVEDTVNACNKNDDCVAWGFENEQTPTFCGQAQCNTKDCIDDNKCDDCCPSGCMPIITDGGTASSTGSSICSAQTYSRCKKQVVVGIQGNVVNISKGDTLEQDSGAITGVVLDPPANSATLLQQEPAAPVVTNVQVEMKTGETFTSGSATINGTTYTINSVNPQLCVWAGNEYDGACFNSPSSWEEENADVKQPDRIWCMGCPKRGKGKGVLYTSLEYDNTDDFTESGTPVTDPLTNVELSCFPVIKNTFGIKVPQKNIWKKDAQRLFAGGCAAIGVAAILLVVCVFLKKPKS